MPFLYIFFFISFLTVNANGLDEIFNTISPDLIENETKEEIKNKPKCAFYNTAKIQITNKTEGKTVAHKIKLNEPLNIADLSITLHKCCQVEGKNYAFIEVLNTSEENILFSGWMFSKFPSLNTFEDQQFDIVLTSCYQN
jgi:hypothetical protein